MSQSTLRQPETEAEAWFYRQGVSDVLTAAKRSAEAIEATTRRPIAENFAIAALDELAKAGRALLIKGEAEAAPP